MESIRRTLVTGVMPWLGRCTSSALLFCLQKTGSFCVTGRAGPSSPVSSASVVTSPPSSAQKRSGAARAKLAVADTSSSSDSAVSADSADDDDDDEQMVAFAPHFVENLLVLGGFTLATNKQNGLLHAVRHDAGHLLCGHLLSASVEVSGKFDAAAKKFRRTVRLVLSHPRRGLEAPLASSATSVAPGTVQLPAVFLQCGLSASPRAA